VVRVSGYRLKCLIVSSGKRPYSRPLAFFTKHIVVEQCDYLRQILYGRSADLGLCHGNAGPVAVKGRGPALDTGLAYLALTVCESIADHDPIVDYGKAGLRG
jgi:hypothetical protein